MISSGGAEYLKRKRKKKGEKEEGSTSLLKNDS
jgi:hypothetical protein